MSEDDGTAPVDDAKTSLPWPTTWPGMYRLVVACFIAYVLMLVALRVSFA